MRESVRRVTYREGEVLDYSFLPRLDRERSAGRGLDTFLLGIAISAVRENFGASAVDEFSDNISRVRLSQTFSRSISCNCGSSRAAFERVPVKGEVEIRKIPSAYVHLLLGITI